MTSASYAYITFFLVTILCNTASAIKCHNCSSYTNSDCATISASDQGPTLVDCPQPGSFCRKTVQVLTDSGETRITRSCGTIRFENHDGDYCMTSNTNFKKEKSCQCFQDGCNDATNITSQMILLVFLIFAAVAVF